MEGREETLGSSKVSLAAVHKKTKKLCLKQDGRHTQQLKLSFDLHIHVGTHTSTGWCTESQVAENWNFFFTWTVCNKQHVQKRPPYTYLGEAGHESCSFWEDASFLLTSLLSFSKALSLSYCLFLRPWCNPLSWYIHEPGNPSRCAWDAPIKTRRPCACQASALKLTHSQFRNWFLSSDHHGVMARIWSVGSCSLEVVYF